MASVAAIAEFGPASGTTAKLETLIQRLEKRPYNHEYDKDYRYFLGRVLRTEGGFSDCVVCEPMLRRASTGVRRPVHVNVWPIGYEATADSPWPAALKMVPFQDFLAWNTPEPTSDQEQE